MRYQAPRGTNDFVPGPLVKDRIFEVHRWQNVEATFYRLAAQFGYREIRTPLFEDIELFIRSSGETSEMVDKEMYDFRDKGDRHIALRPEFTAGVMRSLLEHGMSNQGGLSRLCYSGPVFRYGRPGRGRYRQFHQAGLELVGTASPLADAEVIEVTVLFLKALGLSDLKVMLNCIGRHEARLKYGEAILDHVSSWLETQDDEQKAKSRKNPLRMLDTKDPDLRDRLAGVQSITQFLSEESREHFDLVQTALVQAGIPFEVKTDVVRGLDYYNDTVFEVVSPPLGDLALAGGGRYDNLIQELGGPPTPSVGVGIGLERILLTLEDLGQVPAAPTLDAFLVSAGAESLAEVDSLARQLRQEGFGVQRDLDSKNLKGQFKQADRLAARFALIIGEDEMASGTCTCKELATGVQTSVPRSEVSQWLRLNLV